MNLARTAELYSRQAAEAQSEHAAWITKTAEAKAAHEREREQARLDFEVEMRELRGQVAVLLAERDRMEGEVNELVGKRDEVQRLVEAMKRAVHGV